MKITAGQLRQLIREALRKSKTLQPVDESKHRSSGIWSGIRRGFSTFGQVMTGDWSALDRILAGVNPDKIVNNKDSNLLFDGDYLHWRHGDTTVVKFPAMAGTTPWNRPLEVSSWLRAIGIGKRTSELVKLKSEGPTPPGEYMIYQVQGRGTMDAESLVSLLKGMYSQLRGSTDYNWWQDTGRSKVAWGNYRAMLKPLKGTNTFGRGGMYIHGGQLPGSIGCIDVGPYMDQFAALYFLWSAATGKKKMKVTVKYNIETFGDVVEKWEEIWDKLT